MKPKNILIALLAAVTLLRVIFVFCEDASPNEAYYYLCSERPAAAYFDGPSGTATVVGWAKAGGDFGWRLTSPLWALAATVACYALGRRLAEETAAAWAALALNLLPPFNVASVRVGGELPALTFVLLALLCLWSAYNASRVALFRWAAVGLLAAGAVWFSYLAVPVILCAILFVFCSPRHRRPQDILGAAVAILLLGLGLVPALNWNSEQNWIPVAGGTVRTLWEFGGFAIFRATGQWLMAFALLGVGMLIVWWLAAAECRKHQKPRFIFVVALPCVALAFYFILRGKDATAMFFFAVPLLLIHWPAHLRPFYAVAMVVSLICSIFAMVGAFSEGSGWGAVAAEISRVQREQSKDAQGLFLIAEDAPLASVLGYRLHDTLIPPAGHPPVYVRESPDISNEFALWPTYADFVDSTHITDEYFTEQKGENPFLGRSALYITREPPDDMPQTIRAAFGSVSPLGKITRAGKDALYIYLCLNYETLPL